MTSEYQYQLKSQIQERVGEQLINSVEQSAHNQNELVITLPPQGVRQVVEFLQRQKKFEWMMDICGVHYPEREKPLEAVYHLFNMDQNKRVRIKVPHHEGEKIPSISSVYKAANWFEREAYDMVGIQFEGHPDLTRILCHHEFVGHALRKDYDAKANQVLSKPEEFEFPPLHEQEGDEEVDVLSQERTTINLGPSHPATHGTFRWFCELEGEKIIRSKAEIGYLHRCFEKMAETHPYQQVIPYTDRLNYLSAPMNNDAYCHTIEKMLGVEIPPRAQSIRVILNELSRIIDHMVCIGTTCVDLGAMSVFWYCFQQREQVYSLWENLCGNRMLTSITRIGGMSGDLDDDWIRECQKAVVDMRAAIDEIDSLLTKNRIWLNRMKDTGVVSKEMAIDYGFTGPCLRASGVELDLRKYEPYYNYSELDFDIPTQTDGDNHSRYLIRIEEMRQSCRIIEQCLKKLPKGPTLIDDPKIVLPPKKQVYSNIEALMNHFMLIIEGIQPPKGEVYAYREAANGELGFYLVSDGSGYPYRLKVRPPCFSIYSSFEEVIQGGLLADAIATLGQFNVIAGELDR